jgi:hypothetical protein
MADHATFGGWELDYGIGPGGLVLSKVGNHGYPLATDMRIARLWVAAPTLGAITDPARYRASVPRRSFVPGSGDMPALGPVTRLPDTRAPGAFAIHPTHGGLAATFETATAIPTLRNDRLTVTQRYLFGAYSKNPPHEPGAVLTAARLFPLLEFTFTPGPENTPGPSYFRADFRFDFALNGDGPDLAGVFRDGETVPAARFSSRPPFIVKPALADVFAGGEKPLHHEFIGPGLRESHVPIGTISPDPQTWDNYHQFPMAQDGSLPSTPGAFHCLHLHWRWGAVSGSGAAFPPLHGSPQFKGIGWTPAAGGPLIDPAIPAQDLTLAVTRDSGPGTPLAPGANPSEWTFSELFTKLRSQPLPVAGGARLTLWMSFEVYRPDDRKKAVWGGTLFPHGMYFAHSPEPTLLQSVFVGNPGPVTPILSAGGGLRDPLQKESVSANASPMPWTRYPPGPKK